MKILAKTKKKKKFDFSNYLTKPKFYNDSKKLVLSQIKDEKAGVPIKEFVGLKHENENAVATVSHNKYKDVLLNQKCLRHSMNRIQSKIYKIGTYEINKISVPCLKYTFKKMNMKD